MENYLEILLEDESFYLLPQKAIYRPLFNQLILADLHLGKAAHFRKKGIAFPHQSHTKDIDKLHFLIKRWQPSSVLILGDLFHSDYNKEWLWFKSLLMENHDVQFILVEGNHDVLQNEIYNLPNLLKARYIEEDYFIFSHHPLINASKLNFCGHIHPGIKIYGSAKQVETLPCFYHDNNNFILPAFGNLTGLFILEKNESAVYYLIAHDRVIRF